MKSLQLDKPHAIIVIGIRGSGKTFFAQKFSQTFNAPFIEQSLYVNAAKDTASAATLIEHVSLELFKTGRSIVIEQTISTRADRTAVAKQAREQGYVPLFVWVQTDLDTAMARSAKTSKISQDDFNAALRRFAQPQPAEKALVISGKHTFATQAKAVLKKLSAPRTALQPTSERRAPTRGQIIIR